LSAEEEQAELLEAFAQENLDDLSDIYTRSEQRFEVGQIVSGRVSRMVGDGVLIDIGYKSEGLLSEREWDENEDGPHPGQQIEVLLEAVDEERGMISLSKRKATRIRTWE